MRRLHIDVNEMNPSVRKVGIQDNEGWSYGRKLYDYEILYVTKGKGKIQVKDQKSNLSPGSLILIPPDTPSGLTFTTNNLEVKWVHFDFVFLDNSDDIDDYDRHLKKKHLVRPQIYFHNGYTLPYHMKMEIPENISQYFRNIHTCYQTRGLFWQLRCKSILLEILYRMINQVYTESSFCDNISTERLVHDMRQYMHNHYRDKLTLAEIASYAGISNNYANRLFKIATGKTIVNYLNHYRIRKAINLIQTSHLTMEQIAEEIGFSNTYYFSRVMKKLTGKSPTQHKH